MTTTVLTIVLQGTTELFSTEKERIMETFKQEAEDILSLSYTKIKFIHWEEDQKENDLPP